MVKTGQPVLGVGYAPVDGAAVEVRRFPDSEVLRGPVAHQPVRPDFHVIGLITGGSGRHEIDFRPGELVAGSVFWLRPGQVHRILDADDLRGALMLCTADLLAPGTPVAAFAHDAARPSQWSFDPHDALTEIALRHLELLPTNSSRDLADALRLALAPLVAAAPRLGIGPSSAVFERFAAAVEARYMRWHHVRDYEQLVNASSRTIDRAVRQARGISAKRFLDDRIALEARRQLATSDITVAALSRALGFSEPTNFVKFHRRLTGTTPRSAAR